MKVGWVTAGGGALNAPCDGGAGFRWADRAETPSSAEAVKEQHVPAAPGLSVRSEINTELLYSLLSLLLTHRLKRFHTPPLISESMTVRVSPGPQALCLHLQSSV